MKKYLLPPKNGYKANLHCHTTISDGKFTPEQIKEAYMEKGYSIVAYTDHDVLIPHPELRDENFLPLNSFEAEFPDVEEPIARLRKTCHLCFIALDEDNVKMPFYHRTKYLFGNAVNYRDKIKFDENLPDFIRNYNPECINEAIRIAKEKGFFVTYNHPCWSLERYETYSKYHGMHAFEIFNSASYYSGFDDYDSHVYDEMTLNGERLICIAADDNHNNSPLDSARSSCFRGFTVIMADELSYKSVTDALLKGDCYASTGPEIHEISFEDGKFTVKCSNAERIVMNTACRATGVAYREKGKRLTVATFELKEHGTFARFSVYDKEGKVANSRAYFYDEFLDK